MRKILFSLLLIFTVFNFLVIKVDAAIVADQIDIDASNIVLPNDFADDVETTIGLSGIEGGIGYYQVINITNNQDLLTAYNNAQADRTKINDLLIAMNSDENIMDSSNWEEIPATGKIIPKFEYGDGDTMLLVVKYLSQTTEKYNLKTYTMKVENNNATTKSDGKKTEENKDTGIEDWYFVLVPISIIGGAYLVSRRHRYE